MKLNFFCSKPKQIEKKLLKWDSQFLKETTFVTLYNVTLEEKLKVSIEAIRNIEQVISVIISSNWTLTSERKDFSEHVIRFFFNFFLNFQQSS